MWSELVHLGCPSVASKARDVLSESRLGPTETMSVTGFLVFYEIKVQGAAAASEI
jgi:hypothetical protein